MTLTPNTYSIVCIGICICMYWYCYIIGVVIIDEMPWSASTAAHHDDSDGWQDDDEGFQEVVSKKTRKEKQRAEAEAAQKAALIEKAKADRAAALVCDCNAINFELL